MKTQYTNVIDRCGDSRIAGIEDGKWVSLSAGCASLEGREISESPVGKQCVAFWHGQDEVAGEDGAVYRPARLRRRLESARKAGMVRFTV